MEVQAQQLWTMLDQMSQEDPQAYRQFIDKHLKEGDEFFGTSNEPKPYMSVQTLDYADDVPTIVNFFEWTKVPAPNSDVDPIPICVGVILEDNDLTDEKFKMASVAFHSTVLKDYGKNSSKEHCEMLIGLALDSLENQYKNKLSRNFTISEKNYVGNKHLGIASLMKSVYKSKIQDTNEGVKELSFDNLLKNKDNLNDSPLLEFLETKKLNNLSKPLIEEISIASSPRTPSYEITVSDSENGKVVILRICLPGIESSIECELNVSEDDVVLEASGLYFLHVDLKEKVIPGRTIAKFFKDSSCLDLTFYCST